MYYTQPQSVIEKHGSQSIYHAWRVGNWQNVLFTCSLLVHASIYVIIAHALGPQTFGSYLFAQWLATITIPVIGTGMSTLTSRQITAIQSRETPRLIAGIFYFLWYRQHRSILLYCLMYLSLSFLLARFFDIFTPGLLMLAGLSTLPLLLSSVAGTTLRSLRRSDLLAMLHLFGALLTLLFVIIATQVNGEPVEAFLLAFSLAGTLTLILAVICVIHLLPLEKALQPGIFLKERLVRSLHHSWLMFTLDAIVWQRGELLLLAYCHNPAELGFYALSAIISTKVIGLTPSLFSNWLFPLLLRYLPGHHYLNPYDAFVRTSCYIIFLAVPICSLMMIFSPDIIMSTLGAPYLALVQPLRILLIAAAFGSIATVSLTHLTNHRRITRQRVQRILRWFNGGIALLKIGLAIPFVLLWGMTGAAWASAIAQIASALVSIFLCQKVLRKHETSI